MIILELDDVEVDHCTRCGGVWLDAGELARLLGGEAAAEAELARLEPVPGAGEGRRCPICDRRMEPVHAADADVVVDRCRDGHGMWFDRGELESIAAASTAPGAGRVAALLADVFAAWRTNAPPS